MGIGAQVHVGNGTVRHFQGLSIGGFAKLRAHDGQSARVVVSVWTRDTDSVHFELAVGDSFEFADQTWRLDEIDDRSHRWYATLTRVG